MNYYKAAKKARKDAAAAEAEGAARGADLPVA